MTVHKASCHGPIGELQCEPWEHEREDLKRLRQLEGAMHGWERNLRNALARQIEDWAETLDVDEDFYPVFDEFDAGRRKGAFEAAELVRGGKTL